MVKCADCGFLAVRNRYDFHLDEAGRGYRETGQAALGRVNEMAHYELHDQQPICFALANDLKVEFDNETKERNSTVSAFNVLAKGRDCNSFTKWQQGFTPKEHREMLDREEMLEWQAAREDADRKWRSKRDWYFVIIAGIFTILGAIIGAVITLLR